MNTRRTVFCKSNGENKEAVSVWVRKPARELFNIDAVVAAGGVEVAANGFSEITILDAKQTAVAVKLREGMLVSIGAAKPAAGAEAFVDYKAAAPAVDDPGFQAVLKIPTLDTDDTKAEFIHLAPGYAGVNTAAAVNLYARQPGEGMEGLRVYCRSVRGWRFSGGCRGSRKPGLAADERAGCLHCRS